MDTILKKSTLLHKLEQLNWQFETGTDFAVIYESNKPYVYVKFTDDIHEQWDEVAYTKLHNEFGTSFFAVTDGVKAIIYVYTFGYGAWFEDIDSVEQFLTMCIEDFWADNIFKRMQDIELSREEAIIDQYIEYNIISDHSEEAWQPHFVEFANALFYEKYEHTKRRLPIQIIEDQQLNYAVSKNASGGGYEGIHRTFLVKLPNNEEVPFSISLFATAGTVNDPVYGNRKGTTQLNIAMLDRTNSAYNLQLSLDKYIDVQGAQYEIWHNGIRSRMKKQYVLQTVEAVANFLLEDDQVVLGRFPLEQSIETSQFSHFIENLIVYSYCRRLADVKYRQPISGAARMHHQDAVEESSLKTLLLTGFEPFLNLATNPTEQIVNALHGKQFGDYVVEGHVLPVDFNESDQQLKALLAEHSPHITLSLGVAAGRHHITPERIAINVKDGEADNNGYKPEDEAIDMSGEDGLFTNLPVRALVNMLIEAGYPAKISNSAGTYLCNNIMYVGAQYAKETNTIAGFIHIPANFDIAIAHGRIPGWNQRDLQACIELCVEQVTR